MIGIKLGTMTVSPVAVVSMAVKMGLRATANAPPVIVVVRSLSSNADTPRGAHRPLRGEGRGDTGERNECSGGPHTRMVQDRQRHEPGEFGDRSDDATSQAAANSSRAHHCVLPPCSPAPRKPLLPVRRCTSVRHPNASVNHTA
jgi:hypothetical protein